MITSTTSANNSNINMTGNNSNQNTLNSTSSSSTCLAFYDHNDQELMAQENKYRQYALAVDKALKSFEYTSEWADLVNALGKLNKVLNNNIKFGKIPRRFIVGQRLAQCMHPLLPSGVHLKALETYDLIFNILGPEQLLADLTIYSNGLFPLLGYAAINVRPSVLDLYDRHLLPLGERLQLALDGFLISILPCYDEEGSDSFQRTDGLLLKVADGVGIAYFYGALWRCILQNSSIRLQAITFIMRHFNKKRSLKDQAHVLGLCMRTLVQAICSALLDQQILIQRAILDLLITIFPIHLNPMNQVEQTMNSQQNNSNFSPNKQQQQAPSPLQPPQPQVMSRKYFKTSEMIVIVTASLTVLLRRDLSLNRRLCAWFFGSESSGGGGSGAGSNMSGSVGGSNSSNTNTNYSSNKSTKSSIFGTSSSINLNTNYNKNNEKNHSPTLPSTSSSSSSSSESKARQKKLKYYNTYTKDLVNEAFKRCITNPLTAITSFLPPSVLTNSFITFSMPLPTVDCNSFGGSQTTVSLSSSPSSSTLSLQMNSRMNHNIFRNNSLHGNTSRPLSSFANNISSMSTFWPYRLLICIMDQRDIAGPILDKLCIDILRGLYHEFELLTTEIPPPNIVIKTTTTTNNDYSDDDDANIINTSHNRNINKTHLNDSTTTLSSSSLLSSAFDNNNVSNLNNENVDKNTKQKIVNRKSLKRKMKKRKMKRLKKSNQQQQQNNKQEQIDKDDNNKEEESMNKMIIASNSDEIKKDGNKIIDENKTEILNVNNIDQKQFDIEKIQAEKLNDNKMNGIIEVENEKSAGKSMNNSIFEPPNTTIYSGYDDHNNENDLDQDADVDDDDDDDEEDEDDDTTSSSLQVIASKPNRNLFQNLRFNMKQRFINKLQLGQNNNKNNNETNPKKRTSTTVAATTNRNMKQVMKTLMTNPLRLKIRPTTMTNDGKFIVNRFRRKKKDSIKNDGKNNSSNNSQNNNNKATNAKLSSRTQDYRHHHAYSKNNNDLDLFDDDSLFILPHQHYYWNPFYQQLSQQQRQELLKELDRVMHLLFTNIGVDFIWNNLALIFNTAANESQALCKIINLIIKTTMQQKRKIKSMDKNTDQDESTDDDQDDDEDSFDEDDDSSFDEDDVGDANENGNNVEDDGDEDDDDEDDYDDDLDTLSQSLSWIRNIVPTMLLENVNSIRNNNYINYSDDSTSTTTTSPNSSHESTLSSRSSTPLMSSPRVHSPEFYDDNNFCEYNDHSKTYVKKSTLKSQLLLSLNDRCRQCGKILKYSSPVQPVGTESITIIESCTLARFLLGDAKPYTHNDKFSIGNGNFKNDIKNDDLYGSSSPPLSSRINTSNYTSNSFFINSVSVSMNRCSALEPLEVGTANYTFLIHYLDHVIRLICRNVKSFTVEDFRASIELCLALCSKLKPAIMQTFKRRYRNELTAIKNRENDSNVENDSNNNNNVNDSNIQPQQSSLIHKSNVVSWFQSYGQQQQQQNQQSQRHVRVRSSSSISSTSSKVLNKQLELVREEAEDDDDGQIPQQKQESKSNDLIKDDNENNDDGVIAEHELDFFEDFQIEIVVDGILKFFSKFVEKILIKKSSTNGIETKIKTSSKILDYFIRIMVKNYSNDQQKQVQQIIDHFIINRQQSYYPEIDINSNILPLYQLFCELLIEIGTIPLLSSPAFLFKKRENKSSINYDYLVNFSIFKQLNNEQINANINNNAENNADYINDNNKWFLYLLALSANGIGSCTHWHNDIEIINENINKIHHVEPISKQKNVLICKNLCCQLRHISYISLSTILDLMTMTRAYIVTQPSIYPLKALSSTNDNEFQIPSYIDMTMIDLFPNTFVAKRLNFFPLIHPKMLQFVYESTTWFKLIASGLWSNLSPHDSVLHYSTSALLQQLHSISHDESICEVVICDEMIGGNNQCVNVTNSSIMQPQSSFRAFSMNKDSMRFFHPQHQLSYEQQSLQMEIVHRARTKFALMFSIIRDIRFISERLALVVNALASSARSATDGDNDIDLLNTDNDSSISNDSTVSSKLMTQLEIEIATGMDSNNYLSLMNSSIICDHHDLHRLLRITCPISPISLCSTLKRHFDRPLFIMLDALAQRRNLSEQYSISSDWLLRCIKQANLFGTKNLMFTSPNGFGVTSEFTQMTDSYYNRIDKSVINRILEPLLFILLHPNTARLSIKNVIILRYTRGEHDMNNDIRINYPKQGVDSISTMNDQSRIYAITSTNGNVIYHVRRKPSSSHSPIPPMDDHNTSIVKTKANSVENIQKDTSKDSETDEITRIIDEIVDIVVTTLNKGEDNEAKTGINSRPMKMFPGIASFQTTPTTASKNDDKNNNNDNSGHKLCFAEMHQHLLLYERRYDSLRATYALDTIISIIETWPSHILYAMSTNSLFNQNNNINPNANDNSANITHLSAILDGTRSAQIKTLYQRHSNSIKGDGFYPKNRKDFPNPVVQKNSNTSSNSASSTTSAVNNRSKSKSKSHQLDTSTTATSHSNDDMTTLELIIQICLKYLCSYYPSCPADMASTMTANKLNKQSSSTSRTNCQIEDGLLDELFLKIRSNHCIDLDAIYGNQRVRLLASQALRIIFRNLTHMIEVRNHNRYYNEVNKHSHHKRQPSESLLGFSQSKSYAKYLKELLQKCDVQRIVLQCLATSVWHYQQKYQSIIDDNNNNNNDINNKNDTTNNNIKHQAKQSYLFPDTKLFPSTTNINGNNANIKYHELDSLFVKEILDYNDYPNENIINQFDFNDSYYNNNNNINNNNNNTTSSFIINDNNNIKKNIFNNYQNGFHDEFEKSLLHLLEQIIILESRINYLLIEMNNNTNVSSKTFPSFQLQETSSSAAPNTALSAVTTGLLSATAIQSYHSFIPRASIKKMTEMTFDPESPLLGQTLMNGSIHYALQQIYRRHIHTEWLSFIESSLHYAGRFMPRLVLTTINQLCRNLDSITKEIEQFSHSSCFVSSELNLPPFIHKHFLQTLQAISMIYSYCLLDRNQFDILAPVLKELFDNNYDDWARSFGLISSRRQQRSRYDSDSISSEHRSYSQNGSTTSVANTGTTSAIQTISSIIHNFMTMPISNSNTANVTSSIANSSNSNQPNDQSDQSDAMNILLSQQQDTLPNNLALTRQRILDYTILNRVLTALFKIWCTMIVCEESNDNNINQNNSANNNNHKNQCSTNQSLSCCHPYIRQFHSIDFHEKNIKNSRFAQSNCSLGWSSSIYTGWYITGSSMMLRQSIITILNIVAVSNGVALMKSIARVWHDLRDRNINHYQSSESSILSDSIDTVITPATPAQQKLVQLISSLQPILDLDYLIQIVRTVLKPSSSISLSTTSSSTVTTAANTNSSTSSASSITTEVESTQHSFTPNPFDNIFLIEVSLLEFFLEYIRTCPGELLLRACRSMLVLIKDAFALNLTASVPYETFWPRSRQRQPIIPSSSVQINFQPLINIYLLAIMHEFVITSPFVEDRRAQKELQDVTQRLIDANINVAGGRLLPSRFWSFRRNLEVIPVNSDFRIGQNYYHSQQQQTGRPSPTSLSKEFDIGGSNEPNFTFKRGLFRSSASLHFQNYSNNTPKTIPPTHESNIHEQQQSQNDSLLFGLFNFNLSYLSSGSNHQDLASTSQNLFYSYFCIKALYAMAEFAAPVLDVVYVSEEKEKMIPLIANLMSYVIPYLKSHSQHNLPCFDACSRLLSSFSGYQYTRKAWRRESLELLLDSSFFQMPSECLQSWRIIIDHLMAHDKNTFREFLQRMSITQSPSVSFKLFGQSATKDQELEPRAQLVKRLAFILFCSEKDQYQKYMAEIQEKLIEIHRTSQQQLQLSSSTSSSSTLSTSSTLSSSSSSSQSQIHSQSLLQSQVLLAFRVILLRMSPPYLASLWPFIYTEMFQAFLSIEQALLKVIRDEQKNITNENINNKWTDSTQTILLLPNNHLDIPDFLINRSSSINFVQRTTKLEPKISSSQLQLFLNACKLLDLALLLPSDILPQFHFHKWAFINTDSYPMSSANIRQPIDWLGGISPFSEPTVLNLDAQHSDQILNSISNQSNDQISQQSPLISSTDNTKSETISLNSSPTNYDSQSTGAPQSLPATLNQSFGTNFNLNNLNYSSNNISNNNEATFVPHVVFINHLLNYLTDSLPNVSQTSASMNPLLTMSSIESIHDLHPFFATILSRSDQRTMFNAATPMNDNQNNEFMMSKNRRSFDLNRNYYSRTNSFNNDYNNYYHQNRHSPRPNQRQSQQQKIKNQNKRNHSSSKSNKINQTIAGNGCSLDELYINIDRIIANDFLEPLPSNNQQQQNQTSSSSDN